MDECFGVSGTTLLRICQYQANLALINKKRWNSTLHKPSSNQNLMPIREQMNDQKADREVLSLKCSVGLGK